MRVDQLNVPTLWCSGDYSFDFYAIVPSPIMVFEFVGVCIRTMHALYNITVLRFTLNENLTNSNMSIWKMKTS